MKIPLSKSPQTTLVSNIKPSPNNEEHKRWREKSLITWNEEPNTPLLQSSTNTLQTPTSPKIAHTQISLGAPTIWGEDEELNHIKPYIYNPGPSRLGILTPRTLEFLEKGKWKLRVITSFFSFLLLTCLFFAKKITLGEYMLILDGFLFSLFVSSHCLQMNIYWSSWSKCHIFSFPYVIPWEKGTSGYCSSTCSWSMLVRI